MNSEVTLTEVPCVNQPFA